ncbi:sulfotransferase ssu-1-like [Dermacentor andersoni]|uniref:sulfotransferase ssu-1-like n=1 Tax=Dermacentor andersoni TaxID=34620 RepID=UPI0024176CF1|nr:sulfotransferase ssu-1-like [Dermacentor andersoni]
MAPSQVTIKNEPRKGNEHDGAVYHEIDGYFVCTAFADQCIREALSYKPHPGDIFIVSYPKCGTTWMQHIVYNILNDRPPPKDLLEQSAAMPFLELQGAESADAMPRPGAIKTHMPFHLHPYSTKAKYIYITRNPYDCCISFYYHTKSMPDYRFEDGTFDEFLDMFLDGHVDFGDYFEHLVSWYTRRFDDNVLFVTYEDLKNNTACWIIRIADFIGEKYGRELRQNKGTLARLVSNTSVEFMQVSVNECTRKVNDDMKTIPENDKPRWMKLVEEAAGEEIMNKPITGDFVRKGVVGDWRNHFTPEQVIRMKNRIAAKTAGSDVMNLWKDIGLP